MTRAIVTGAAGFIGSHLSEKLLDEGYTILGIDNFDPWYDPEIKKANIHNCLLHDNFDLIDADIRSIDFLSLFKEGDTVFHLAARPGVQDSWGKGFADSVEINIFGTQRIFEAALHTGVRRVVFASSSSIYGASSTELERKVHPISPYGVSKAACEQLAEVYRERGLDLVPLRYFTVYGPRQRPDMAMNRLFRAALPGSFRFPLRGNGNQRREFTFVKDVINATIAAGYALKNSSSEAFDIGGGVSASLAEVMDVVEEITGTSIRVDQQPMAAGDPLITVASTESAKELLGWEATTSLRDGLQEHYESFSGSLTSVS